MFLVPWLVLAASAVATPPPAAPIRAGFREVVVASGFDSPVSMAFAPDGRLFVCEQAGRVRVVKRGRLLARPLLTVPARCEMEAGLLGIACDPGFARNGHVYVCWTRPDPVPHEVIERYTVAGDSVLAGSARTIFELDPHGASVHVGGTLRFGTDGKLWVGSGDNDRGETSQSLRSTFGKLLRLERDGSIPADNPFNRIARGKYAAIWARGLRNPFSFDFQRGTGRLFLNDVGGSRYEEVNDMLPGGNYGWPVTEGPSVHAAYRSPVHSYSHASGCAITGGAFYQPARALFPREWEGRWLFAEYCAAQLRWLDPANPDSARVFGVTSVPGPVDLRVGPDGALYYLARGNCGALGGPGSATGSVVRVAPIGR